MSALLLQNLKLIMLFLLIGSILGLSARTKNRVAARLTTAPRGKSLARNIDLGAAQGLFDSKSS